MQAGHRHWVWLACEPHGALPEMDEWLSRYPMARRWWCGDEAPDGFVAISPAQAARRLGEECDLLVFDARQRFAADAFGCLSGTLVASGSLLLLMPGQGLPGRFGQRLQRCLADAPSAAMRGASSPSRPAAPRLPGEADPAALTEDQAEAVRRIRRVAQGHRRRPLVITADRGRGKSAALGIAAARLLQAGCERLVVTAARRDAVSALLQQVERLLGTACSARPEFVLPDELLRRSPKADLVLVDEAAAIPVGVLRRLLRRHARIVFATTTHGYEGSGRGFSVRFKADLDRLTPQWRDLEMHTPIRWSVDDPLERLTFDALLLDAEAAPLSDDVEWTESPAYPIERIERDRLLEDDALLRQVFGLLVEAHYRTRPSDLQRLLDDPGLSVWVVWQGGAGEQRVVATALVMEEGGLAPELAEQVAAGKRRPAGHLLPQTLAAHAGSTHAATYRYARISRIAVHQNARRQGLGHALLARIQAATRTAGLDFMGSSFGASDDLMGFWRGAGLQPVRVGLTRDAASGTHSVVWLLALNAAAEALSAELRTDFFDAFEHLLAEELADYEAPLVLATLLGAPQRPVWRHDQKALQRYAAGELDHAAAIGPLWRRAWNSCCDASIAALPVEQRTALIRKLLQKRSWSELVGELDLPGKAAAQALLREAVVALLA